MKLIYICSPYAGETEQNIKNAQEYCRYVMDLGNAPIAVHLLYPQFLDDSNPTERATGIAAGLRVLAACDELWQFGDTISSGMKAEIAEATRLGIPVVQQKILSERTEIQMCQ